MNSAATNRSAVSVENLPNVVPHFLETKTDLKVCDASALGERYDSKIIDEIDAALVPHYHDLMTYAHVEAHANQLSREGYTKITDVFPAKLRGQLQEEFTKIMDDAARRIDIQIDVTDNSPRKMETVNYDNIVELGRLIPHLYYSKAMRAYLTSITRHHIYDCPYDNERFTGTRQTKPGDTHGWHWGDHQYALIFIVTAPSIEHGGMLQNVPHTLWNKSAPRVHEHLCENEIITHYHGSGDCYFFKTDSTLHRTYPLEKVGTRIIMNMSFSGPNDLCRDFSHETMDAIFDFDEDGK